MENNQDYNYDLNILKFGALFVFRDAVRKKDLAKIEIEFADWWLVVHFLWAGEMLESMTKF